MTPKKEQAIDRLRSILSQGERLFIVKRWQSRDGSYQTVDVYRAGISRLGHSVGKECPFELERITELVCDATGFRYDAKHKALGVGGCHPDSTATHVVGVLGHVVYGDSKAFEFQEI